MAFLTRHDHKPDLRQCRIIRLNHFLVAAVMQLETTLPLASQDSKNRCFSNESIPRIHKSYSIQTWQSIDVLEEQSLLRRKLTQLIGSLFRTIIHGEHFAFYVNAGTLHCRPDDEVLNVMYGLAANSRHVPSKGTSIIAMRKEIQNRSERKFANFIAVVACCMLSPWWRFQ